MGGRGASSASSKLQEFYFDGGENSDLPWDRTHPAMSPPKTLDEALGKKGRPMGMTNSYTGANPFYSDSYREYSENCQRCVVAYELRRRGYRVTAQPTFEGDRMPSSYEWIKAFDGAIRESVGGESVPQARQNLQRKMESFGPGARAIVSVRKDGSLSRGHVFNAENIGGKISYVDAQSGVRYDPKTILNGASPSSVYVVRTDGLKVSDTVKDMVWTRGSR